MRFTRVNVKNTDIDAAYNCGLLLSFSALIVLNIDKAKRSLFICIPFGIWNIV